MIQHYGSGRLIADFSKHTGIKDDKVDMIVKNIELGFTWDSGMTTTTTAPLPALARFSGSTPGTLAPDEFRKAIMGLPIVETDKPLTDYRRIYFNFQAARQPWWSHSLPALTSDDLDEREEIPPIDERELYEREWRLRDILPRDGWIPREV